ncbi:hypothetical protein AB0O14_18955 [Microbacterium foliorum]|uniref:hypothetical protein n=1 Tax=Rothia terrae TaxID=396015 RepID=UPI0034228A9A
MTDSPREEFPEELNDWIITEQLFKENGLDTTPEETGQIDFLRNVNMVGRYLATNNHPVVQFAKFNDQNLVLSFDETEPIDLPSPFYPIDDEHQVWVINNRDVDELESNAFESPQISALTAFGYDANGKMFLFNLQSQTILGINGAPDFSRSMVRALAVEHIMEPWNAQRSIYLVGFEKPFASALKHQLADYHSSITIVEKLTDLAHDYRTLEQSSIFCIGQDPSTVSEFIKSTGDYAVAMAADIQIGGAFTYYQETGTEGALEPGNIYLQPMLMSEDSEDYETVLQNYEKALSQNAVAPETTAEPDEFEQILSSFNTVETTTDESLSQRIENSPVEQKQETEKPVMEEEEPAPETVAEPLSESTETPQNVGETVAQDPELPDSYLALMGESPRIVTARGDITGINAEIIAYTYLQQNYAEEPATFAGMCRTLWQADAAGSEKSTLSQRRKRAKDKVATMLPGVQFITERDGWHIHNLPSDIDLLSTHPNTIHPSQPLTATQWATPYIPALEKSIATATGQNR